MRDGNRLSDKQFLQLMKLCEVKLRQDQPAAEGNFREQLALRLTQEKDFLELVRTLQVRLGHENNYDHNLRFALRLVDWSQYHFKRQNLKRRPPLNAEYMLYLLV